MTNRWRAASVRAMLGSHYILAEWGTCFVIFMVSSKRSPQYLVAFYVNQGVPRTYSLPWPKSLCLIVDFRFSMLLTWKCCSKSILRQVSWEFPKRAGNMGVLAIAKRLQMDQVSNYQWISLFWKLILRINKKLKKSKT